MISISKIINDREQAFGIGVQKYASQLSAQDGVDLCNIAKQAADFQKTLASTMDKSDYRTKQQVKTALARHGVTVTGE